MFLINLAQYFPSWGLCLEILPRSWDAHTIFLTFDFFCQIKEDCLDRSREHANAAAVVRANKPLWMSDSLSPSYLATTIFSHFTENPYVKKIWLFSAKVWQIQMLTLLFIAVICYSNLGDQLFILQTVGKNSPECWTCWRTSFSVLKYHKVSFRPEIEFFGEE